MPGGVEDVVDPDVDDVLMAYGTIVGCSIDEARDHLLRAGALESALGRPRMHAYYSDGADIAHLAAVLAHGIAESQSFIDGNKRTASLVMLSFLADNGYELELSDDEEDELAAWIIDLHEHIPLAPFADWIRDHLTPAVPEPGEA